MSGENQSTVYEVLDHAASGIRLQVEFQRRINASLLASQLPFIRAITVHNETGRDLPGIELSAGLAVESDARRWLACREEKSLPSGGSVHFNGIGRFSEFDSLIGGRNESALGTLSVTVHPLHAEEQEKQGDEEENEVSLATTVEIGASGEFLKRPGTWQSIAVFVQPQSKAVTKILQLASELLLQKTGKGDLDGYKTSAARAKLIAEAIYLSVREEEIVCGGSPASFEAVGQKLKTAGQVLDQRFGDCIELSVTYAACCEAAGLHPIIIFTASRAFPAFVAVTELEYSLALGSGEGFDFLEETVIDQAAVIARLVSVKAIIPVELGVTGQGKRALSFSGATKKAINYILSLPNELKAAVAISQCRREGIHPALLPKDETLLPDDCAATEEMASSAKASRDAPPPLLEDAQEEAAVSAAAESDASASPGAAEDGSAESAAGELSAEEPAEADSAVIAPKRAKDDIPARIRQWKQSLFDFGLSNPLLNLLRARKSLELDVSGPELGKMLDDLLYKDGGCAVAFKGLEPVQAAARLRSLRRLSRTLEQETSRHHLYLALGTLVHPGVRGKEARSPLFLLPVAIGAEGLSESVFGLSRVGDEPAQSNACLAEWLRTVHGLALDGLDSPAFDLTASVLGTACEKMRQSLLSAKIPWRIEESASLAILDYAMFHIWKDIDRSWPVFMENSVVRRFIDCSDGEAGQVSPDDATFAEERLPLPLPADGSQMAAIAAALDGKSFVLEGAPGSGKSQVIVNLIAHGLEMGKRILFVSGKEAALETVSQRLESIGLGDFTLAAYGSRMGMNDIRQQLKRSMRATVDTNEKTWKAAFDRYAGTVAALRDYTERLHARNAAGFSLWSAYDELARLGDGPGWELDPNHIGRIDVQAMSDALGQAVQSIQKIGGAEHEHWLLLGLDSVDNLTFTTLTSALEALAAARKQIRELGRGWPDAFRELKPGKMLITLNECVAANQLGLLPSKAYFRDIDRAGWRSAVASLREKLEFFIDTNQDALSTLVPGLTDSPMLNDWTIRATSLEKAKFFAEFRRRSLRKAIGPLVGNGVSLKGSNLLSVLQSAQHIRAQVTELRTHAAAIVGLLLPTNWGAHRPHAQGELDAAINLSKNAVWLERNAPMSWLKALEPKDAQEIGTLKEIEAAWSRWLNIIGATEHSIEQWLGGRNWLDVWDESMPRWEGDLAGTGLLQLQRRAMLRKELRAIGLAGGVDLADKLARNAFSLDEAETMMRRGLAQASLQERLIACGMEDFDAAAQDKAVSDFLENTLDARKCAIQAVPARLLARRPFRTNSIFGEVTALVRQIERKRAGMKLREISARYPEALLTFAPVFLMCPGSVASILDAGALKFDMVIFDEASRMQTAEAIGAIGRARSVVIVGDTKQLPPDGTMDASPSRLRSSGAEQDSILSAALDAGLPRLRLKWHYRSENEELIAFPNARYYGGELAVLPRTQRDVHAGITWRQVNARFLCRAEGNNPVEARALVDELTLRLRDPSRRDESLGVLCLNSAQCELILDMLEESEEPLVQEALAAPAGRRLFVKSFEYAQGEERDVILISLVLSPDPASRKLPSDFGVLSAEGGGRWLNVAVTRARKQVRLLTSFAPEQIDTACTGGVKDLRDYLMSINSGDIQMETSLPEPEHGMMAQEIAGALEARGYVAQTCVGHSAFRVDIAVKRRNEKGWRLAIMLDGPERKSRLAVADRCGMPSMLRALAHWPASTNVWLPAWLRNREEELARLIGLVESSPRSTRLPA